MYQFYIDINPLINGTKCHLEGTCEMSSDDTFKVTMKKPFAGLSVIKHFDDVSKMSMEATFAQVEKDLVGLYISKVKNDQNHK